MFRFCWVIYVLDILAQKFYFFKISKKNYQINESIEVHFVFIATIHTLAPVAICPWELANGKWTLCVVCFSKKSFSYLQPPMERHTYQTIVSITIIVNHINVGIGWQCYWCAVHIICIKINQIFNFSKYLSFLGEKRSLNLKSKSITIPQVCEQYHRGNTRKQSKCIFSEQNKFLLSYA